MTSDASDRALLDRAYALWRERRFDDLLDLCAEDVEWNPPSYALEPGLKRGREELRAGINSYFESFEEFWPEPVRVIEGSEPGEFLVLVRTHARGRGSGASVTIEAAHRVRIEDGRFKLLQVFTDRDEAARAAGVDLGAGEAPAVRAARPGEEDAVAAHLGAFRDHLGGKGPGDEEIAESVRRIMAGGDGVYLLAFDEAGEAVGVAQLRFRWSVWTSAYDCWLEDVFVREQARGSGIGRALVEAALDTARSRGCKRIELDTNDVNEAAIALYESCGFSREPKPPGASLFMGRRL